MINGFERFSNRILVSPRTRPCHSGPRSAAQSVGDTGIEPVPPTVSTFSARRWLRWLMPESAGYGSSACWSGWLRWLLSGVVLHNRCTSPPPKLRSGVADLVTRFKPQAVPLVVAAFHRAGVSLVGQRATSSIINGQVRARRSSPKRTPGPRQRSRRRGRDRRRCTARVDRSFRRRLRRRSPRRSRAPAQAAPSC